MAVGKVGIYGRMYIVTLVILLMSCGIVYKLMVIQFKEGDELRQKAKDSSVISEQVPANRGNIYSSDGSLLATSVSNYTIRFDSKASKQEDFDKFVKPLSDSLGKMLSKPSSYYERLLRKGRKEGDKYILITRNLSYTEYVRIKAFPLFKLGANKGGFIAEQKTVRKYPMGDIAQRTIGYERVNDDKTITRRGIEGSFSEYLSGIDGYRIKQKISRNHYKPINDENEVEPKDGKDIVSTIDVYIQDIAHHALLKELEYQQADHGCVVVMETETGAIKAISNLGRSKEGTYTETINYAVTEKQEPGSTFKLAVLLALLEDRKVDTARVYDTNNGAVTFYRRTVRDSKRGGYGKISLARGIEVSSNTVAAQALNQEYKANPAQFTNYLEKLGLDKPLGISIKGEANPNIPKPGSKSWSGISLPWMAFGYGLELTPLQILTLYNAVANNGEMVKPLFVSEVKEFNKTTKVFEKEVINPQIASPEVIKQTQTILENVIKKGTGRLKLYSPNFSMAGKTGTAQVNYGGGKGENMYYSSSFVGYFPADSPKYSCIVIINRPLISYYGGDVTGPVFKRIAQKIYTDVPFTKEVNDIEGVFENQNEAYNKYYAQASKVSNVMPKVKDMYVMDAIPLLENIGLEVRAQGIDIVKSQSINTGEKIKKGQIVVLE